MKFLIWIGLALVIFFLLRVLSPAKRQRKRETDERGKSASRGAADRSRSADDRRENRELMMRCSVCGVHIPSSDAVFARGRVFCGPEHRDAGDAGPADRS